MGIILSMASAASMVANPLCNYLRDMLGSYVPVFWGTAVVSVAVTGLYLVMYGMNVKDRKEFEKKQAEGEKKTV